MLYLLFVLTFLAGILFYGLSPSDKKLDETAHQAEGMIVTFLAQHQAARDYLYTWLGAGPAVGTSNIQMSYGFLKDDFEKMRMSHTKNDIGFGVTTDMCYGNQGVPGKESRGPCFVSQVICLADDDTPAGNCQTAHQHYVITYGGWENCDVAEGNGCQRPNWWPSLGQKMRRYESWRKAIANRTRGSVSCGTLRQVDGQWCIDNGETVYKNESAETKVCVKQVPRAVLDALPQKSGDVDPDYASDLLFCMSEFKEGWNKYYDPRATYFYDGLDNIHIGQHDKTTEWINLVDTLNNGIKELEKSNWPDSKNYYNDAITTNITLEDNYILTVVAAISPSTDCPLLKAGESPGVIFKKQSTKIHGDQPNQPWQEAFSLTAIDGTTQAGACNQRGDNNIAEGIISWTFVVRQSGVNQTIDVYENATKRSSFSNYRTISSTSGQTLSLGCNGGRIYAIRYYPDPGSEEQVKELIQKNFKVDQKRFGLSDINNGRSGDRCVNEETGYTGLHGVYATTTGGGA